MRYRRDRRIAIIAICFSIAFLSACLKDKETLKLSMHRGHWNKELMMDCSDCHRTYENLIVPDYTGCPDCHKSPKRPSTKGTIHYELLLSATREADRVSGDIIFEHKNHNTVLCEACHPAPKNTGWFWRPEMSACIGCHIQNKNSISCDICHKETKPDIEPKNHTSSWKKTHTFSCSRADEKVCSRCHGINSCKQCHLERAPDNHIRRNWAGPQHGIYADIDRESCKVCHEGSSCRECHQQAKPGSHFIGNWVISGHSKILDPKKCYMCHHIDECITCHIRYYTGGL